MSDWGDVLMDLFADDILDKNTVHQETLDSESSSVEGPSLAEYARRAQSVVIEDSMLTDDSNGDGDYIPGKDDVNYSDSNAPPDISEPELSTPGNKESDINEIQCEKSKKKKCLKRKKKCSKPKPIPILLLRVLADLACHSSYSHDETTALS